MLEHDVYEVVHRHTIQDRRRFESARLESDEVGVCASGVRERPRKSLQPHGIDRLRERRKLAPRELLLRRPENLRKSKIHFRHAGVRGIALRVTKELRNAAGGAVAKRIFVKVGRQMGDHR